MSDAAPSYRVVIHVRARSELHNLDHHLHEEVKERIFKAARKREPSDCSFAKHLKGGHGLFAIRVGDVRAICKLVKPYLLVLLVDGRGAVYDRLETAQERAAEGALA